MTSECRLLRQDRGFTLTELAVVMVIAALLVGGLLLPLSAQLDVRNLNDNRKAMAEVREALLGFAAANGRLPCPAATTTASEVAGAGVESALVSGVCPNHTGVLPWATLGVSEGDAWGHRFTYRVSPVFVQSVPPPGTAWPSPCTTNPQNAAFVLCSRGELDILSSTGGNGIASDVPAVIISHGKNGNGAYTAEGTQLAVGSDADERENQIVSSGATGWTDDGMAKKFVKRSTPTASYDDEVVWIPPGLLFNRMITAGRLP
ncbi:MAG: prepilin-type N-terminal cleavage/methylation domain-containing protein [Candidatus Accumulibacter sp.]|uniref:Prepilin-type N-terminal cleavage/methylation domain-containing protein n=1 Tax=Candidatus Accumulibacter affinis TaxID=2954384 RepID=A0A935TFD6_9PROT|nr:prepilin-type N-terminal cleavage/methylation domain-containing protein [Candidatus Accumulibacter affinis]